MARSIVEYFSEHEGYRCGYCKSEDTNYSHGMWAHILTTEDYQALIDRGWRRSGSYCYKPIMKKTCCPMYTIKCAALQFKPSRSQKKILKKFKHFIEKGEITASRCQSGDQRDAGHESSVADRVASVETRLGLKDSSSFTGSSAVRPSVKTNLPAPHPPRVNQSDISCSEKSKLIEPRRMSADSATSSLRRGGRKAKDIRRERWRQKQLARGMEVVPRPPRNAEKSLEERLSLARGPEARHVFEVRLVSTSSDAFAETFAESLEVYQKYQVAVHGDTVEKCSASQFKRFLCKSPLLPEGDFGTYHRQYLIDGRIVAVGVLDILPHCVSSVYLFYDPEFSQLSLGTYTSLSEIAFVRELHQRRPGIQFYYLGFYIHSCPKMRYKGQYAPSFLSCPESYSWIPIELCSPLLSLSPYSRLQQDKSSSDPDMFNAVKDIKVLFCRQVMEWEVYRGLVESEEDSSNDEVAEVTEYGRLVGQKVAARMLLFRAN